MPNDTRTESDSFGPIEVPADAYWGAQTERSIENFPFGPREQLPIEIVHALGFIKQAAARVNARIGGLDPKIAEVIQQAAGEVARGDLDGQFPLVIWQTGSGTQSNNSSTGRQVTSLLVSLKSPCTACRRGVSSSSPDSWLRR